MTISFSPGEIKADEAESLTPIDVLRMFRLAYANDGSLGARVAKDFRDLKAEPLAGLLLTPSEQSERRLIGGSDSDALNRSDSQISIIAWLSRAARWDWYSASVRFPAGTSHIDEDRDAMRVALDLGLQATTRAKNGKNGYRAEIGFGLRGERDPSLKVMGCNSRTRGSFFLISGGHHELCEKLRTHPAIAGSIKTTVGRADVCVDLMLEPGVGFDQLEALVMSHRGDSRLKIVPMGTKEDGRTLNIGVRKSKWCMRIYEKGLQQRGLGVANANEGWVRCEVEFNSPSSEKQGFLKLSPAEALCVHTWVRTFFEKVAVMMGASDGDVLEPMKIEKDEGKVKTVENSAQWALRQTARTWIKFGLIYCFEDPELKQIRDDFLNSDADKEDLVSKFIARSAYLGSRQLTNSNIQDEDGFRCARLSLLFSNEDDLLETSKDAEALAKSLRKHAEEEARLNKGIRSYYNWVQDFTWTKKLKGAVDGASLAAPPFDSWAVSVKQKFTPDN